VQPRNYIVPQQINVRVAIRYRADWAIGKFGTVRRNRGRNVVRSAAKNVPQKEPCS